MQLSVRQQEIVEAAMQLISERSIQELTIKNLSGRLGVTEAALYRHFRGKNDILVAMLEQFAQRADSVRRAASRQGGEPIDLIEEIFIAHIRGFVHRPPMADVVFSEEIFRNDTTLASTVQRIMNTNFDAMLDLVVRGQKARQIRTDVSARIVATIVIGTLRMLVTQWRMGGFTGDLGRMGRDAWNGLRCMISA